MNMDLSGRQTRRVGVWFTDDERARRAEKEMNESLQQSLNDLLKARGDISYVQGVKGAADAFANMLHASDIRLVDWPKDHLDPWLAHLVVTKGECGCFIESDYDEGHDITFCKAYEDKDFRRLWFLAYHGLTEEELVEQEREAARLRAEEKARREAEHKEMRRQQLLQLAREFDVDPKYLP